MRRQVHINQFVLFFIFQKHTNAQLKIAGIDVVWTYHIVLLLWIALIDSSITFLLVALMTFPDSEVSSKISYRWKKGDILITDMLVSLSVELILSDPAVIILSTVYWVMHQITATKDVPLARRHLDLKNEVSK